jgi:putative DeoR family transcriptional regulator (stage III sporulation protein D)
MRREIQIRVVDAAEYIAKTGATVRACARKFGVSKSTVHKDMRMRLPLVDRALAREVDRVLGFNRAERHLRGGQATKLKYRARRAEGTDA